MLKKEIDEEALNLWKENHLRFRGFGDIDTLLKVFKIFAEDKAFFAFNIDAELLNKVIFEEE